MISPFTTFIYFSILTTVYFSLKYLITEKHEATNKSLGIALSGCYLIIMVLLQLSSNMANAKEKCGGTPQTFSAINYTIIPNLFIFGASFRFGLAFRSEIVLKNIFIIIVFKCVDLFRIVQQMFMTKRKEIMRIEYFSTSIYVKALIQLYDLEP